MTKVDEVIKDAAESIVKKLNDRKSKNIINALDSVYYEYLYIEGDKEGAYIIDNYHEEIKQLAERLLNIAED